MHMEGDASNGFWSVPSEHLPGLVALAATPVVIVLAVLACRLLAGRGSTAARAVTTRLDQLTVGARVAVVACLIGAAVHAAIVPTHWAQERTMAILFGVAAMGFVVVALLALLVTPGWRAASIGMLVATTAAYVYYLMIEGESADLVGVVTTTLELAAAMLLLQPVAAGARTKPPAYPWVAAATVPVALVTVFAMAAVAGQVSDADDSAADGQKYIEYRMPGMAGMHGMAGMSMGEGKPLRLDTASPAGTIDWPVSHEAMGAGMTMSEPNCTQRPTAEQQRAAVDLVNRTAKAVERYRSLAVAEAAGYVPVTPTGRTVVHYIDYDTYLNAAPLDPSTIPSLVYVNTPRGAVLSAAMYLMPLDSQLDPPQPGGCLTQWHVHHDLCFRDFAVVASTSQGACPAGSVNRVTPPMMHVWVTPVAGGALAMDAADSEQVRAAMRLPAPARPNGRA